MPHGVWVRVPPGVLALEMHILRAVPVAKSSIGIREASHMCRTARVTDGAIVRYPVQVRVLPGTRNTFFLECVAYLACERRERL